MILENFEKKCIKRVANESSNWNGEISQEALNSLKQTVLSCIDSVLKHSTMFQDQKFLNKLKELFSYAKMKNFYAEKGESLSIHEFILGDSMKDQLESIKLDKLLETEASLPGNRIWFILNRTLDDASLLKEKTY